MNVGIIGLGLIGGSMAIDLKKRKFADKIIGFDQNKLHLEIALKTGIIDEQSDIKSIGKKVQVLILAVPSNATIKLLPDLLNNANNTIITDVSSVKHEICRVADAHKNRKNYVAAHPMAGTEFTGPWAAKSGLFDGKAVIVCDSEKSDPKALELVLELYDNLHMRPVHMDAVNHDEHAAYVSHISHISSFALALTVLKAEKNERNIFNLASGGFDSTVRLAKSSAEMWTPIFQQNSANVISVLETYIEQLEQFKTAIQEENENAISNYIIEANKIKKILS